MIAEMAKMCSMVDPLTLVMKPFWRLMSIMALVHKKYPMKSLLTTKVKGGVRGLLFQNTFDGVGSDSCRERAVLGLGVSTLEVPGILVELADS